MVQFYISIGKKFDAPALYIEAAKLLEKYSLIEEAIQVLNAGLKYVPKNNRHREQFVEMKRKLRGTHE